MPRQTDPYTYAAARCARQECCRSEVVALLVRRNVERSEAERMADQLEAEGYINAKRYVSAFVRDKHRFAGWGRTKIRAALLQKALPQPLVDEALSSEIDDMDYADRLRDFLHTKRRQLHAPTPYALNQKLARSAIARGFEPALVFKLLKVEGGDADEEWDNDEMF